MKLFLDIHNPLLLEGLKEVMPQIETYSLAENEAEAEIIITDQDTQKTKPTYKINTQFPINFEALIQGLQQKFTSHEVAFSHFLYNPRLRHLRNLHSGEIAPLTEKESALLLYFFKRIGQDVHRDDLAKDIWGHHEGVDSHTLETHIYRLRHKIEDDPKLPQILLTTPGGYQLKA